MQTHLSPLRPFSSAILLHSSTRDSTSHPHLNSWSSICSLTYNGVVWSSFSKHCSRATCPKCFTYGLSVLFLLSWTDYAICCSLFPSPIQKSNALQFTSVNIHLTSCNVLQPSSYSIMKERMLIYPPYFNSMTRVEFHRSHQVLVCIHLLKFQISCHFSRVHSFICMLKAQNPAPVIQHIAHRSCSTI